MSVIREMLVADNKRLIISALVTLQTKFKVPNLSALDVFELFVLAQAFNLRLFLPRIHS